MSHRYHPGRAGHWRVTRGGSLEFLGVPSTCVNSDLPLTAIPSSLRKLVETCAGVRKGILELEKLLLDVARDPFS